MAEMIAALLLAAVIVGVWFARWLRKPDPEHEEWIAHVDRMRTGVVDPEEKIGG